VPSRSFFGSKLVQVNAIKEVVISRKSVAGASERSLALFVGRARRAVGLGGQVAVLITSSRELRRLNRRFRGQDRPTDVLSFPAASCPPGEIPPASRPAATTGNGRGNNHGGDIAISADIASANARRLGHSPADELKILALHGILHLAGYDHEHEYGRKNAQGKMARLEARLRRELGLPEALIERASMSMSGCSKVSRTRTVVCEAGAPSATSARTRRNGRPR